MRTFKLILLLTILAFVSAVGGVGWVTSHHLPMPKNIDAVTAALLMRCPAEGAFIAWKQCQGNAIIKLSIPAEARRSSATGYKCRAEFVDVIEGEGVSIHDGNTVYTPGQRVTCHEWDANRWNECGGGIHFYMSRKEAEAHS